jgi:hypothetical protein
MYLAAGILFAGSQVVFFLASQPLCDVRQLFFSFSSSTIYVLGRFLVQDHTRDQSLYAGTTHTDKQVSNRKINSSFLATILQTSSMVIMYFAWEVSRS